MAASRAIGTKGVGRLMRAAGVEGVSRRRSAKTTTREQHAVPWRRIWWIATSGPPQPDRLWVTDIAYVATWIGLLYVTVVPRRSITRRGVAA